MNINLTILLWALPSCIALGVLRGRKWPTKDIFSLLGWRRGALRYYLVGVALALVIVLPHTLLILLASPRSGSCYPLICWQDGLWGGFGFVLEASGQDGFRIRWSIRSVISFLSCFEGK